MSNAQSNDEMDRRSSTPATQSSATHQAEAPAATSSVNDSPGAPPTVSFGMEDMVGEEIAKNFLNLSNANKAVAPGNSGRTELAADATNEEAEVDEASAMRDTEFYKGILRSVRWQRDNYLVGRDYANESKERRAIAPASSSQEFAPATSTEQQQSTSDAAAPSLHHPLPFDATALGNIQVAKLGSWFIPSPPVHNALLPIVVALPAGALHQPILRATANLIPLSQANLDIVMKNQIISVLDNQAIRDIIKSSTKGYISTTYRDARR